MNKRVLSMFLAVVLASSQLVAIAKEDTASSLSQAEASEVLAVDNTNKTVQESKKVLSSENFDKADMSDWEIASGSGYKIKDKALLFKNKKTSETTSILLSKKMSISNGDILFDLKFESGMYFGIVFRADDDKTLYTLRFYKNAGMVKLLKRVKNGALIEIKSAPARVKSDEFSNIGIRLAESNIMVMVDGVVAMNAVDSSLTGGVIGFDGYNAQAVVDNVEIVKFDDVNYTPSINPETGEVIQKTEKEELLREIYVKPTGDTIGDGSKEKPIVGVQKAIEAAKNAKRGGRPVNIIFTEGVYEVRETIELDGTISGTEDAPVRFMAEEGSEVVFTGSKELNPTKFKPVTGKMEKRIHSAAKGNVRMMKFSASEIPAELKNFSQRNWTYSQRNKILQEPMIFINDELQTLAEWPNGDYEIILDSVPGGTVSGGDLTKGGSIMFSNTEPVNWLKAERPFVQGHLGVFWHGEAIAVKNIDLTTNQINLQYAAQYAPQKDHRWKMVNLIEELDVPGEYYIDEEESVLYIYPTHELTKEDKVEIGILQTPIFALDGVQNVIIEGLEFKNTFCRINDNNGWYMDRGIGHGIQLNNIKNVTIRGCEFHHIGVNAIHMHSGSGLIVEENYIHDIGHSGVMLYATGNRTTLTPSNTIIRNNVIAKLGIQSENNSHGCVEFYDNVVDVEIYNNLFHSTKNSAIRYRGNGHRIYRNEFSSVCNEMADAGSIYCGRSVIEWGTKIYENYFHDIGMKVNTGEHPSWGVFWDDELSGQELTRNIFVVNNFGMAGALHMSGWDHVVENNTCVNSDKDWVYSQRSTVTRDWLDRWRNWTYTGWDNKTYKVNSEAYLEKYPDMIKQLDKAKAWDNFMHLDSVVSNNLAVNTRSSQFLKDALEYGTIENNVTLREDLVDEIFVDPQNQDYRVKNEARVKYNIPEGVIGEEFDLDLIGLQTPFEYKDKHKEFRLLAPANNLEGIQTRDVCLTWSPAAAVDVYRYQIATDPEFKNIIEEDDTIFKSIYPKGLANNMTYYWRVYGINTSRTHGFEVESVSGTFKFTTIAQDTLYMKMLEDKIDQGNALIKTIKEGTKTGEFAVGTKDSIRAQIKEAQNFIAAGKGTQKDVEQVAYDLNAYYKGVDQFRNVGYETLDLARRGIRTGQGFPIVTHMADGSVLLDIEPKKTATFMLDEILSNYNVMKFRAKLKEPLPENSGWFTMGLRGETAEKVTYSQDMYYVIVKNKIFELQKKGVIYQTAPNEGKFKQDDWNDVELAAITTSKGIHMYFKLNGEVIFDYLDTSTPNYEQGMFGVFCTGCALQIADSPDVPDTLFQRSEEIQALLDGGATALGTDSSYYTEKGTWSKHSTLAGFKGKEVRTSSGAGGSAMWQMLGQKAHNGKVFKVSYYHVPSSDGDKNVKVTLENYMGNYETTVDMSKGAAGWVELGTFRFINASSMPECFITFTPSGEGVANINAVQFEVTEDGENMFDK